MVLAPEHPLIAKLADKITNMPEVQEYQRSAAKKSDLERSALSKEKTGVDKGHKGNKPCD